MPYRSTVTKLAAALCLLALSCGPRIDLATALSVTDTFSGWYDYGVVDGLNKLVPSITFRLRNVGAVSVNEVQLTVSFWKDGDDGEWDSKEVTGIGAEPVEPGASSDPVLVRSEAGYTLEQARSELFTHSQFRDVTAKVFAKRDGKIVPLGEFKLERRILPHTLPSAAP
jgi:hypothetical protein